ncbi:RAMP superfamily CRISPR-associated protein [Cellulosilyticum ruminicola]|uniref:RAMP superfamily CRISPR-associated protein n=1 Tax=Cellulosilyticum ruminicola TaxID=425254 RepID=UPI0006CFBDFA|nr:RAMP superfamily CRISPR-associated protein [Cellulosilyticum ruminicola]
MAKPYSFVEFIEYRPYRKEKSEEKLSGVIPITLEVITPLHVGSGHKELAPEGLIYNAFYKWNDTYAIPGSTIKGCIRSIAESISHSCLRVQHKDEKTKKPLMTSVNKEERNGTCIVCDVFGSMKIKGKVNFGQLLYVQGEQHISNLPNLKETTMLEGGKLWAYKFYHHGKHVKVGNMPHEVMKEKTIFKGKISYMNLTEEELMLLCFSLGLSGDIQPKLGYGKPGYYGSVKISSEVEEYAQWAAKYKEHPDQEIQRAITDLTQILNYDFAKVKSDWIDDTY